MFTEGKFKITKDIKAKRMKGKVIQRESHEWELMIFVLPLIREER